jgi:hypothetical protein
MAIMIVSSTMTSQILPVTAAKDDDKNNNRYNNNGDLDATFSVDTDKNSDSTSNALVEIILRSPDCLPTTVKTISSSNRYNKNSDKKGGEATLRRNGLQKN